MVKFPPFTAEIGSVPVRVLHITATPAWQLDPLVQQVTRLETHGVETMLVNRHAVLLQHEVDDEVREVESLHAQLVAAEVERLQRVVARQRARARALARARRSRAGPPRGRTRRPRRRARA